MDTKSLETNGLSVATLGGGCFWCLEAVFELLDGVREVASGYTGGKTADPDYESVCTGRTGHAEVIRVTFDRSVISYRDLLDVFFAVHDPTTLNRQGADVGTQYRSAIYYHSPEQKATAEEAIAAVNASGAYGRAAVTEVTPAGPFYRAEEYHQGYYRGHTGQSYCQAVISPKVAKLRQKFAGKLRS